MIEARGLSKRFAKAGGGRVDALSEVDLSAFSGRIHALLGPNGSGKTTLLRCLAGLLKPDRGELSLAGMSLEVESVEVKQKIGFMSGSMKLPARLTPREVLEFFGRLRHLSSTARSKLIGEIIDRLGMGDFADQRMESLSMGQRQRAGVAQAMFHQPEILILDEITVGLDVLVAREIIELVREAARRGACVLFSTHIMGEVTVLADSLTILHQGRVVFDGDLAQLDREKQEATLEDEFVRRLKQG